MTNDGKHIYQTETEKYGKWILKLKKMMTSCLFGRFKIKSNEWNGMEKIYTNVAKDAIAVVRPETGAAEGILICLV
jgi:hypothetical protein